MKIINKVKAEKSLKQFIKQAWPIVESKKPLFWNWHLDAICQHLEAVTNTYIIKSGLNGLEAFPGFTHQADPDLPAIHYLWINIPPRCTKSLIVNVFWPVWEWGPKALPELSFLSTSYAQSLSIRDSVKRRRIIEHHWYQKFWGNRFKLTSDQNQKQRFENNRTGHMIATSIHGLGTGEGGDRVIVDDAHNVNEVESDVKRTSVIDTWDNSMSSRLNNEETGTYIGIMQRVHHKDLTGHLLDKVKIGELKHFVHLCLPARYETDHPHPTQTPLDFKDPRTEVGEPLDKVRMPEKHLDTRESRMTGWAIAGQHQQRPGPKGGSIVQVGNIQIVDDYNPKHILELCRYWDKAASEDLSASKTASVLMARMSDKCPYGFLILHTTSDFLRPGPRERFIRQNAELDGVEVFVGVEQEPGSGGKESALNTIKKTLVGFKVFADRPTGAKDVRLEPFAAQVEHNNVAVLNRGWTRDYLAALESCAVGSVSDEGDASSGSFNHLAGLLGKRGKIRVASV